MTSRLQIERSECNERWVLKSWQIRRFRCLFEAHDIFSPPARVETEMTSSSNGSKHLSVNMAILRGTRQQPAGDRSRGPLNVPNDQAGKKCFTCFPHVWPQSTKKYSRNLLEKNTFSQIHVANWSQLPFSRGFFVQGCVTVEILISEVPPMCEEISLAREGSAVIFKRNLWK